MYVEHQRSKRAAWTRVLYLILGIAIVAIGIVALPAPGPGALIIAFGAALVARESGKVAKWLDRFEVYLRQLWRRHKPRSA